MSKTITMSIYDPPKPRLPFLVVAIFPDGKAQAVWFMTEVEAQAAINGITAE